MKALINILLISLIWFPNGFCGSEDVNLPCDETKATNVQHLGSKTPYRRFNPELNVSHYDVPNDCSPLQIWMLIRHGSRLPGKAVIQAMQDRLPQLRDAILENHANKEGTLCDKEINALRAWLPVTASKEEEKFLVDEGTVEMANLARRMRQRLPSLLATNYSNGTFQFRYTSTQRTEKSAHAFVDSLFGEGSKDIVWFPEAMEKDPILRFYKGCSKWQHIVDDHPQGGLRERLTFEKSPEYAVMQDAVATRAGFLNISSEDLQLMYEACSYESAWHHAPSPWCSLFSPSDLEVVDYAEDLEYYWTDGYGYDLNHDQACPAVHHLLQQFQRSLVTPSLKGEFHFTHSGTLLKLLAHLGLYKDSEPLLHSTYQVHKTLRKWRAGQIDVFASNLGAVLYRCGAARDPTVLLFHQERPVALQGCSEDPPHLCPLELLLQRFMGPGCHFQQLCQHDGHPPHEL